MPNYCCVPSCKSSKGGHLFPRNEIFRKKWIEAVNRAPNWVPTKNSAVCHRHFLESDYIKESYYHGTAILRKLLKRGAVPSVNIPPKVPEMFVAKKFVRECRRPTAFPQTKSDTENESCETIPRILSTISLANTVENKNSVQNILIVEESSRISPNISLTNSVEYKNTSQDVYVSEDMIQVVLKEGNEVLKNQRQTVESIKKPPVKKLMVNIATQTLPVPNLGIEKIKDDDKAIKYFTGINTYTKFVFIFRTLGRGVHNLKYYGATVKNLSVENQFLLTLTKIRKRKSNFELGLMFGVGDSSISNILLAWIPFMANQWKEFGTWPDKEVIEHFFPSEIQSTGLPQLKKTVHHMESGGSNREDVQKSPANSQNTVNKLTGEILRLKQYYHILNGPFTNMENNLAGELVFICCMLQNFKKGISKTAKK